MIDLMTDRNYNTEYLHPLTTYHQRVVNTFDPLSAKDPWKDVASRIITLVGAIFAYPALTLYSTLGWIYPPKDDSPPKPTEISKQFKEHVAKPEELWKKLLNNTKSDITHAKSNPAVKTLEQHTALTSTDALDSSEARNHCKERGYTHTARVRGDNNCGFYSLAVILVLSKQEHLPRKIEACIAQTKQLGYQENVEFTKHVDDGFETLRTLAKGKTWNDLHSLCQDPARFSNLGLALRLMTMAHVLTTVDLFFEAIDKTYPGFYSQVSLKDLQKQNIKGLIDPATKQTDLESFLLLALSWYMPLPFITKDHEGMRTIDLPKSSENFALYRSGGHFHPLFKSLPI